ncbi:MAG: hypothetical protein QOE96_1967 [Blastocatellia bacterium]|jgi:hypothetical protein|nr:hypothetical protein [Blastocatellia bacterium]
MKTITVTWKSPPADARRTLYYVDDCAVGEGDAGFEKILDAVRSHKNIQLSLKIPGISSLGGGSLIDSLPFNERFEELMEALGENKLIFEFS